MNYRYQLVGIGDEAELDYSRGDPYDDWANLRFDGGAVGDLGASSPATSPSDSITAAEAKEIDAFGRAGDGSVTVVGPTVLVPGTGTRELRFDVTNSGPVTHTFRVAVTSGLWPGVRTVDVTVPAESTTRAEVTVPTAGLRVGTHPFNARLLSDDEEVGTATGTVEVPDVADPAVVAQLVAAAGELTKAGLDPDVAREVGDMVDVVTPEVTVTSAPTVTGRVEVGSRVEATPGAWSPDGATFGYQWLRNGTAIPSATSVSYVPTVQDHGTDLSVRVTPTLVGHKARPATSVAVKVAAGPADVPTAPATFTGTARVGQTLTGVDPTWNVPVTVTERQWLRGDRVVATGPTYVLGAADAGQPVSWRVVAARTGYEDSVSTSGAVTVALGDAPAATALPQVRGTATFGSTLSATPGSWSTPGVRASYTWLRDGAVVPGATGASYTLTLADVGHQVAVRVTASLDGHASGSASSAPVSVVAAAAPVPRKNPSVSHRRPAPGVTLKGSDGTWPAGTRLTRQWLRDGAAIPGATGASYRLSRADVGRAVALRVEARLDGHVPAPATSGAVRVKALSRTKATVVKKRTTARTVVLNVAVTRRGAAGRAAGTVVVKQGRKVVARVKVRKGVATVKVKRGSTRTRLVVAYAGDRATWDSRGRVTVPKR